MADPEPTVPDPAPAGAPSEGDAVECTQPVAAGRIAVFQAWLDPGQLVRWWGPAGFSTPSWGCRLDPVPQGRWRTVLISRADHAELWVGGTYLEVAEPSRIVLTYGDATEPDVVRDESQVTVTFEPDGADGTVVRVRHDAAGERAAALREQWRSSLARLAEQVVAGQP